MAEAASQVSGSTIREPLLCPLQVSPRRGVNIDFSSAQNKFVHTVMDLKTTVIIIPFPPEERYPSVGMAVRKKKPAWKRVTLMERTSGNKKGCVRGNRQQKLAKEGRRDCCEEALRVTGLGPLTRLRNGWEIAGKEDVRNNVLFLRLLVLDYTD